MSQLKTLVAAAVGETAAETVLETLVVPDALRSTEGAQVPAAVIAMALNSALFHDLLMRAPTGAAYVADVRQTGERILFDHGALRTVRFPEGATGALPAGRQAFTRILEPLGYRLAGTYPLPALKMAGFAYAHEEWPEDLPQFFISELLVGAFPEPFQAAACRVFGTSIDPLAGEVSAVLAELSRARECELGKAMALIPALLKAFGRVHDAPTLADYELLLSHSAEAAWIATEGQAFNHATDRVADVEAVASAQRALGRDIKDKVEVSRNGTVRQTAFRADPITRPFRTPEGVIEQTVPGSFYEFITRDRIEGRLDLRFDSQNAQGIFKMTAAKLAHALA